MNMSGELQLLQLESENLSSWSKPCTSNLVGGVSAELAKEEMDGAVSCETAILLRRTSELLGAEVCAIFFVHIVADELLSDKTNRTATTLKLGENNDEWYCKAP